VKTKSSKTETDKRGPSIITNQARDDMPNDMPYYYASENEIDDGREAVDFLQRE
jgi:hypothetical protein